MEGVEEQAREPGDAGAKTRVKKNGRAGIAAWRTGIRITQKSFKNPETSSWRLERQQDCITAFAVEAQTQGQVTAERLIIRQLDHDFR